VTQGEAQGGWQTMDTRGVAGSAAADNTGAWRWRAHARMALALYRWLVATAWSSTARQGKGATVGSGMPGGQRGQGGRARHARMPGRDTRRRGFLRCLTCVHVSGRRVAEGGVASSSATGLGARADVRGRAERTATRDVVLWRRSLGLLLFD
jgi:hypothetical protein